MVRRALTRSIKKIPPAPDVAAKYMHFWVQGELYTNPDQYPHYTSQELFGNDYPLELEVGSGTGEFLCSLAKMTPDVNFVGVDNWTKVVYRSVEIAAALKLDNIKFIRGAFQFTYSRLVPNTLQAIYFHYPDPNIRNKDEHKLFNPGFLDAIYPALVEGGRLHVVSDHEQFFEEMLTIIEADPRWQKTHVERHLVGYDPAVKSRYQLLWEKHEVPPLRFEVVKQSGEWRAKSGETAGARDEE